MEFKAIAAGMGKGAPRVDMLARAGATNTRTQNDFFFPPRLSASNYKPKKRNRNETENFMNENIYKSHLYIFLFIFLASLFTFQIHKPPRALFGSESMNAASLILSRGEKFLAFAFETSREKKLEWKSFLRVNRDEFSFAL